MNPFDEMQDFTMPVVAYDSFTLLIQACVEYVPEPSLAMISLAYEVAAKAHDGVKRRSGEPYIEHPLAVAHWLAVRRADVECIVAALLHDVVEDTPISLQRLRNQFGPVVAILVDGVTKFEVVELTDDERDEFVRKREQKQRQQAETFRKLLLTMAEDPRVALIKLADRLHNLRTLGSMRPDRQVAIARETFDIYIPLADRLGIAEMKYELQDLALKYIDPQRFAFLKQSIDSEVENRQDRTNATLNALKQVIARFHIEADITPQVKHLFSVHRRIGITDISVREIPDLIVYRVLVANRGTCYSALEAIHSRWQPLDARVRDYIGSPKLNGYQSLHTTVFGFDGLFDVHIRTKEMQRMADRGPLLMGSVARDRRREVLKWITQVRSWQRDMSLSASEFIENVTGDLFHDQIFVFTPKGDVKDLPVGSTVLDLAYRIHTHLGHHCVGAHVTGNDNVVRLEGREYVINSGEIVHIITRDSVQPDAQWLKIVKMRYAHDAILHYLRDNDLPMAIDEEQEHTGYRFGLVHLAFCCEPGPGDSLVGVLNGKRLTVHRVECHYVHGQTAKKFAKNHFVSKARNNSSTAQRENAQNHCVRSQKIQVRWETLNPESYRVTLSITGQDRSGLMHDVARIMADESLNIMKSGAHAISSRFKATIWITIEVQHSEQLSKAYQRLMSLDGVVSISRRERVQHSSASVK